MPNRVGQRTLQLQNRPAVAGYAAVVGQKEGEGPLADQFDRINEDSLLGEASFERAESALQKMAVGIALEKAGCTAGDVQYIFAGDLLNQCIGSSFGLRDYNIPFIGLYGACSTMALSLAMAAIFVDSGAATLTAAVTSSHFCSAERQFRFPLEYGGQRTPTAQWTVTGSGACVVGQNGQPPFVRAVTVGTVADLGITDINNMGAAMAPAAAQTLCQYFADTGHKPEDFDLILTGDLGFVGSRLLERLAKPGQNRA